MTDIQYEACSSMLALMQLTHAYLLVKMLLMLHRRRSVITSTHELDLILAPLLTSSWPSLGV
jgi:hypothetical protein